MKRFTGVKGIIILIVLIAGIVAYYGYLSNKTVEQKEADKRLTKVQSVLMRDMEFNYPITVKEVVKYYGEIVVCLYDGTCEENDVEKLAAQALKIYDADLVDNNPWPEYITNLKNDIAKYSDNKMKITGYAPAGSTSVDYFEDDGYEWARIYCTFYVQDAKSSDAVNEIILLRRDDNERWKIYGWDLAENVNIPKE